MTVLIANKSAKFHYTIEKEIVAGLVLHGWEVKSLRRGHANLKGSWVKTVLGELFLEKTHIRAYDYATNTDMKTMRGRKLLINKREREKMDHWISAERGVIIPLSIITQGKYIKCVLGMGKAKKKHEKRQALKERSIKKAIRKEFAR